MSTLQFKMFLIVSLLIVCTFSAQAEPMTDPLYKLKQSALKDQTAYKLIESLTTEVGPRIAGSDGDKKAVAWAERKFAELGFDNIYKQPLLTRNWQRGVATAQVLSPAQHQLVVTALGGTVATPKGGLQAEVVQFKSLDALKQAKPEQVTGKIVFINKKMKRDKTGKSYGQVVVGRTRGAIEAAKLGAVAIVIRSVGTDSARFAHTGSMRYSKSVPKIPAGALSNPDADLLERLFNLNQPVSLSLQLDAKEHGWQTTYNVIGEITGSEKPEEVVLIAAHLDSWDEGTGALDDGAGVGIVMSSAALIKQLQQPKRTIRVVLFANEEFGLKGAKAYVKNNKTELDKIIVAAESDFGAGKIWRFDTRFNPSTLPFADQIFAAVTDLGIERGHNQTMGGPDVSIMPNYGVPVVGWVQDGSDYFDYHHTANDTFDKIVLTDIQQNVAVYSVFTYLVANSDMNFRPIQFKTESK